MKRLALLTVFIAFSLVLLTSCDYLDVDLPFLDNIGAGEETKHIHNYTESMSDADAHFYACRCGDVTDVEPHVDSDDGICSVCAYVMRDILTVTVTADECINLTASEYYVKRGEGLIFSISAGREYSVMLVGAEVLSLEIYGDLIVYSISVTSVLRDATVTISATVLPCTHDWIAPGCEAPEICTLCGETKGEALGHKMSDATCTAPATCIVCGMTEGEALGHKMSDATCVTPATCTVCGMTEGEALGHKMSDATCVTPATCTVCGMTDGEALGHKMSDATCTASATCTVCGMTEGEAQGHKMSEATCITPSTCSRCGLTEGTTVDHTYTVTRTVQPTCTQDGYNHYACSCGMAYQTIINATGHEGGSPLTRPRAYVKNVTRGICLC